MSIGIRHGRAKLTDAKVLEIRRKYAAGGITQVELSTEFGIAQSKISAIVRQGLWTHLGGAT